MSDKPDRLTSLRARLNIGSMTMPEFQEPEPESKRAVSGRALPYD